MLDDSKYINRLWQFIFEGVQNEQARDLLQTHLGQLGERLERVHDLAHKGVHSTVTVPEMFQAVLETYQLVGDILRVFEATSAASMDPSEFRIPSSALAGA